MAIADLTDVQVQQAEEVGRCMRTHVDNIQKLIARSVEKDAHGRIVATAPLSLTGDELLAVQGLCTLFTTADGIFGGGR